MPVPGGLDDGAKVRVLRVPAEDRSGLFGGRHQLGRVAGSARAFVCRDGMAGHISCDVDDLCGSIRDADLSEIKVKDRYINEAINYIESNFMNDISVESIAKRTGLERSYFGKLFKKATDMSPQRFLLNYSMTKAAEMLRMTNLPVAEIGRQVGYPDQLHFSRAFKSIYGLSPRNWKKEIQNL